MTTMEIIRRTRAARSSLHTLTAEDKNRLLLSMAQSLRQHTDDILAINARDVEAARGKISDVMLDRLRLDEGRVAAMADGLCAVSRLPDHTGRILSEVKRPNGMTIYKSRCLWAWWPSSTRAAPMSPPMPRPWPLRVAMSASCAAVGRPSAAPGPSPPL